MSIPPPLSRYSLAVLTFLVGTVMVPAGQWLVGTIYRTNNAQLLQAPQDARQNERLDRVEADTATIKGRVAKLENTDTELMFRVKLLTTQVGSISEDTKEMVGWTILFTEQLSQTRTYLEKWEPGTQLNQIQYHPSSARP